MVINIERELEASRLEYQELIYAISHDLCAPLRHIRGFKSLLVDDALKKEFNDDQRSVNQYLDAGIQNLEDQLMVMLEISRLSTRRKKPVKFDLNDLIHKLVSNKAIDYDLNQNIENNIKLDGLPKIFYSEIHLIEALFLALIDNAFKFRSKDQEMKLVISMVESDSGYQIKVIDHGIGILDQMSHEIFKPFKRLNLESKYAGLGCGLTKAKRIVQLLNGSIFHEDKIKENTQFSILLPQLH